MTSAQTDLKSAFTAAVRHHQAGRLSDAEELYREILTANPGHADSLHLLGAIATRRGRHQDAIDLIEKAIRLRENNPAAEFHNNIAASYRALGQLDKAIAHCRHAVTLKPGYAEAFNNLSALLDDQGQSDEALTACRQALALKPDYPLTHFNLAKILHRRGDLREAAASYRDALKLQPMMVEAHSNLGAVLADLDEFDEAATHCQKALVLRPDYAEAHYNLGNVLRAQGKDDEAAAAYRQALALKPAYAEASYNLGLVLMAEGRLEDAAACYRQAIATRPEFAEAHCNLGLVMIELNRPKEGDAHLRRAIEIAPDFAEAHCNLGIALMKQGSLADAAACLRQALALQPDYLEAHNNLGSVLTELDRPEDAIASYESAIALDSSYAQAHENLGIALMDACRVTEAAASFRRAQALKPEDPEPHWNEALALLLGGDFDAGWKKYEWRRRRKTTPVRTLPGPMWDGGALTAKTLLIFAEQGFGDTLQFIRYAPIVQQRGAKIVFEAPAALARLLASVAGIDRLVTEGDPLPPFDCHAPLLSLPGLIGTDLDSIPAKIPYLCPEIGLVDIWQARVSINSGLHVGIVWRGSPGHRNDRRRSIPADAIASLCTSVAADWIGLNPHAPPGETALLSREGVVRDFGPLLTDWAETAALVASLDLIVTVDTAVAHLAGALGKPTWVLLPFSPDWRWMLDRADSPWYPTLRLFRQPSPGDWSSVLSQVAAEIRGLTAGAG